jgi:AcrR family transcriptional regulator
MIRSASLLMRERGIEATSFSSVLELSRAPRGSIYHHFPGGKAQLIEEATRYAGEFTAAGLAAALAEEDAVAAVRRFTEFWRTVLADSSFAAGCPVVAAALDAERSSTAREAAGEAFASWQAQLATAFESRGVAADRARSLSALIIAAIEGAVVLARAERSAAPLDEVAGELELVIAAAL